MVSHRPIWGLGFSVEDRTSVKLLCIAWHLLLVCMLQTFDAKIRVPMVLGSATALCALGLDTTTVQTQFMKYATTVTALLPQCNYDIARLQIGLSQSLFDS